jgi:hypothetical protein
MEERLAAGGGQQRHSCEQADGHPANFENLPDEPERAIDDGQRQLGGEIADHARHWAAERLADCLGGIVEQ